MTSNNNPSLCIPRTFPNVGWRDVKQVFEDLLGKSCVDRVDVVSRQTDDGEPFNRIFIHFRYWPSSEVAQNFKQRILAGEVIKLVYDEPWYWKVAMSRLPRPEGRVKEKKAPYIEPAPAAPSQATLGDHLDAAVSKGVAPPAEAES